MTVKATKAEGNLTALLTLLRARRLPQTKTFWFSGDSTETDFAIDAGWDVENVFVDGAIYRPGTSEDYTVSDDGFKKIVVFAVAPGVVDIGIVATRAV